jgi:hypothetical protein
MARFFNDSDTAVFTSLQSKARDRDDVRFLCEGGDANGPPDIVERMTTTRLVHRRTQGAGYSITVVFSVWFVEERSFGRTRPVERLAPSAHLCPDCS